MRRPQCDVYLRVDGVSLDPEHVYPLFQSDPHPGGHQYSLSLSGAEVRGLLKQVWQAEPVPSSGSVTETEARKLFRNLAFLLDRVSLGRPRPGGYRYFLNSVESMIVTPDKLELEGECSPVLGSNRDSFANGEDT